MIGKTKFFRDIPIGTIFKLHRNSSDYCIKSGLTDIISLSNWKQKNYNPDTRVQLVRTTKNALLIKLDLTKQAISRVENLLRDFPVILECIGPEVSKAVNQKTQEKVKENQNDQL